MSAYKPRILPFVPVNRDDKNKQIDLEIQDQERAKAVKEMVRDVIDDLDLERVIKGDVTWNGQSVK